MSSDAPSVLTADDVASALRVSPMFVYRAAKSGDLPCIRLGKSIRFTPSDVNQFVGRRIFKEPQPLSQSAVERARDKQRARQRALRKLAKESGGRFDDLLDDEYEREGFTREDPPELSDDWRM